MISEPMVCLAQTVQLSCTDTNPILKQNKTRFYMTHGEFHRVHPKTISEAMVCLAQTVHYLMSRLALSLNILNWASTWASSPSVPSGASKTIFEPKVCLAQTMHLSCTDTNTVFEQSKLRFHKPRHLVAPLVIQNNFWASSTFGPHRAPILC
jgi:hypothetical protein